MFDQGHIRIGGNEVCEGVNLGSDFLNLSVLQLLCVRLWSITKLATKLGEEKIKTLLSSHSALHEVSCLHRSAVSDPMTLQPCPHRFLGQLRRPDQGPDFLQGQKLPYARQSKHVMHDTVGFQV